MKPIKLTRLALVLILAVMPVLASCDSDIGAGGVLQQEQADCDFKNNASETADSFISRCREAGIRREFPGEYYSVTLGEIDRSTEARGKKARKLLTSKRWQK
jgi:hypothetical protein